MKGPTGPFIRQIPRHERSEEAEPEELASRPILQASERFSKGHEWPKDFLAVRQEENPSDTLRVKKPRNEAFERQMIHKMAVRPF